MPDQSLAQIHTPEEEEAEYKQAEIDRLEDALAAVKEETETLTVRLHRFEAEYTLSVAPHYLRLDRWKLRCEEARWMIQALRQITTAGGKVADFDHFRSQRDQQFRAQWDAQRQAERDKNAWPVPEVDPDISEAEHQELRQLYRELAKRFHPDLATTPSTKEARDLKMKEINDAYQANDVSRLRLFRRDPDLLDKFEETIGERLVRLIRELNRLRRLLLETETALESLRQSDLGRLLAQFDAARAQGSDGLTLLIARIGQQTEEAKSEWGRLRAEETELWKVVD